MPRRWRGARARPRRRPRRPRPSGGWRLRVFFRGRGEPELVQDRVPDRLVDPGHVEDPAARRGVVEVQVRPRLIDDAGSSPLARGTLPRRKPSRVRILSLLRFFRFLVCSLNGAQGVPSGDFWSEKRSRALFSRVSPISRMAGVRSAPALARRSSARRTSRSSNSTRMVTPATGPAGLPDELGALDGVALDTVGVDAPRRRGGAALGRRRVPEDGRHPRAQRLPQAPIGD